MIFLDNASTTKMSQEAITEYINASNFYLNPSALYGFATIEQKKLRDTRLEMLRILGGSSFDNIIFTSGATEANNMAINGCLRKDMGKLLFSLAEHPSVYNVAKELKNKGYNVEFINLTADGTVDEKDYINKLEGASFVSIMHVCNETGAVNDIKRLVRIAKRVNKKIIFHCDGVQALGKVPVNLCDLGVDMYTISAHKIHGPKGVGALYVKNTINLKPLVFGGGQENGLRSGTENTSGIASFRVALKKAVFNQVKNYRYVTTLKEAFINEFTKDYSNYRLISTNECSPFIISIAIPYVKAETILHMVEADGVLISNGSACSSKNTGNRILEAMGVSKISVTGALRISFSCLNSKDDVILAAQKLKNRCIEYLNKI